MTVVLTDKLRREIGQHFVVGCHGHEVSEDVKVLIREYYVGNIILMKRNIQSVKQVHTIIQELQQIAKDSGHERPLMVGIDQENGLVSAFSSTSTYEAGTQFPGAMALAATGSVELAEQVSSATGHEMKLAGINWAYSPVADVNSDPRNPVIGVRSFGDNPKEVGLYATAVSRGLTAAGIAPSPKHFPGHGDTHVDSHLALPIIKKPLSSLLMMELSPFQSLIQSGCATIMTGHMALPLVTGDNTPCSLSKKITTDLLRGQMNFDGVVVTDCLEMEAVANGYGSERAAVLSLVAGADVAMICHTFARQRGAVLQTWEAVENGEWSVEELEGSSLRIEKLKERFAGSWEEVLGTKFDEERFKDLKKRNEELSKYAYAASIALVNGPLPSIPKEKGTVLVLTPEMESLNKAVDDAEGVLRTDGGQVRNTAGPSYLAFAAAIARRVASSQHIVYTSRDRLSPSGSDIKRASAVVFVTRNADRSPWQIGQLMEVLGQTGAPMVLVQSCGPYDLLSISGRLSVASIASFEYTRPALEAAAGVLFGESQGLGRVPVFSGRVGGVGGQ
ncbi:glycoside hydrolase family 3 protein [Piloderma croceum F 1598]|uniref:Glycoside hydrolase family 3 protein n=1 Tax=Piloderma croceum (strain F 1598) TaxID=765440 RepID=A0A0C3FCB3_PILCF|nr:glycoside hydrolase family 3 protein [Piloderma croceum F 1598]